MEAPPPSTPVHPSGHRGPGLTRFALRGSARLAYDPGGPAAPDAVALVLLHDLLADRAALSSLRDAVIQGEVERYRAIVPEARGHGASAALATRRYTVPDLAADVLAVMDAEDIEAAHLVGHGLGGATAFALAREAPNRVRSLTLVEPMLPGVLKGDRDPATRALGEEARAASRAAADASYKELIDKALGAFLDPRWGLGWRERLPRPRLAAVRRHAGALAGLLTALDAYAVGADDVRGVTLPALVVHGDGASAEVRVTSERLVGWLPGARKATIPSSAEPASPLAGEAGEALGRLLAAFLAAVDAR